LNAVILGVSPDTPPEQKKFHEKFSLPFDLLCDTDRAVAKAYDVWKERNMYGKIVMGIERTTFIIGTEGNVAKVFPKVKADGHADKVLDALSG
jgi:peroxiredoxin Q/BCP